MEDGRHVAGVGQRTTDNQLGKCRLDVEPTGLCLAQCALEWTKSVAGPN